MIGGGFLYREDFKIVLNICNYILVIQFFNVSTLFIWGISGYFVHTNAFGISLRVNLFFLVIFVFGKSVRGVLRGIASESHWVCLKTSSQLHWE